MKRREESVPALISVGSISAVVSGRLSGRLSGLRSGEDRGLVSRTVAGNRAYDLCKFFISALPRWAK